VREGLKIEMEFEESPSYNVKIENEPLLKECGFDEY
jgi:hypothetical protein